MGSKAVKSPSMAALRTVHIVESATVGDPHSSSAERVADGSHTQTAA